MVQQPLVHVDVVLWLLGVVAVEQWRRRWLAREHVLAVGVHRVVRVHVLDGRRETLLLEGGRRDGRLLRVRPRDVRRRPALVLGQRFVAPHHWRTLVRRFRFRFHEAEYVARVICGRLESRYFAGAGGHGRGRRYGHVVRGHNILQETAGVEAAVTVVVCRTNHFDWIALWNG